VIHGEAIRLTRLLDDLLDLSVLENGQVTLDVSTGTVGDLLDQAIAASTVGERLRVIRSGHQEDQLLTTDLGRLTQVFINLIKNAEKYTEAANPRLAIKVRAIDGKVFVEFTDNGLGVPSESRALIFEKFARGSDPAKAGGAGLGLAICREIMSRLGGRITYVPGQGGASFRVTIPQKAALAAE
ncbi:MAG: sensor histidine kinase, partial [Shimia sp.]